MKNIKTTLVTLLLVLGTVTGLKAQDKYEYASVIYRPFYTIKEHTITLSYSNKNTEILTLPREQAESSTDQAPVLKQIFKMQNEGWELVTSNMTVTMGANNFMYTYHYYSLRKKIS